MRTVPYPKLEIKDPDPSNRNRKFPIRILNKIVHDKVKIEIFCLFWGKNMLYKTLQV